jgi:hypothetical protein
MMTDPSGKIQEPKFQGGNLSYLTERGKAFKSTFPPSKCPSGTKDIGTQSIPLRTAPELTKFPFYPKVDRVVSRLRAQSVGYCPPPSVPGVLSTFLQCHCHLASLQFLHLSVEPIHFIGSRSFTVLDLLYMDPSLSAHFLWG